MLRLIATALIALGALQAAQAADPGCEAQANDKHLAGAARNSFMTKCEKTARQSAATTQCNAQADDKKLHGAARTSFVKKCVKTAESSK